MYLFSGALDPVGAETRGVRWLIEALRNAGVTDVTHRFYAGARHEMLNETNRDEVTRDSSRWLDGVLAREPRGVSAHATWARARPLLLSRAGSVDGDRGARRALARLSVRAHAGEARPS